MSYNNQITVKTVRVIRGECQFCNTIIVVRHYHKFFDGIVCEECEKDIIEGIDTPGSFIITYRKHYRQQASILIRQQEQAIWYGERSV